MLRIAVTDPRGDRLPRLVRAVEGGEAGVSGYGLVLVGQLAERWGVRCGPVPCKTVWAELRVASPEPGNTGLGGAAAGSAGAV